MAKEWSYDIRLVEDYGGNKHHIYGKSKKKRKKVLKMLSLMEKFLKGE